MNKSLDLELTFSRPLKYLKMTTLESLKSPWIVELQENYNFDKPIPDRWFHDQIQDKIYECKEILHLQVVRSLKTKVSTLVGNVFEPC